MQIRHLVVIGASAGGLDALRQLVAALPRDFPAPIAIVLHTAAMSPGVLHEILSRSGPLPAVKVRASERLQNGHIYVAAPDFHLLVEPGVVRATKGPHENRFRPAIDPLFRSAAQVYGPSTVGVILSGNLDDGTAGLWAIKQLGGVAVVQDPADAPFPSMPQSAIDHVQADYVVPLAAIPTVLSNVVEAPMSERTSRPASRTLDVEVRIAREDDPIAAGVTTIGEPSTFTCPECHGVLLQLKEAGRVRFRCHTGHAYSIESLLAAMDEGIAAGYWNVIRALQEAALLLQHLGAHVDTSHTSQHAELKARAEDLLRQADTLRAMVMASSPQALVEEVRPAR